VEHNSIVFSLRTRGYISNELPEGHEILTENFTAPDQPVPPCTQRISALVDSLKDLVYAVRVDHGSSGTGRGCCIQRGECIEDSREGLWTPDEASAYLRIPKAALNRECRKRAISYISINVRGDRRFRKEDLDAFLERQRVGVPGSRRMRKDAGNAANEAACPKGGDKSRRIKQDRGLTDLRKEIQELWQ
jgi:excisionase family DNA binding protein